jgi:hypothetical protein
MAEHNGPQQEWRIWHILETCTDRRTAESVCERMLFVHGSEYQVDKNEMYGELMDEQVSIFTAA